jgi:transcriptional regulator with XRE-family HTH domain
MRPARDDDAEHRRRWLTQALKAVRRRRQRSVADTADALSMPIRSYERFEAARERLNLDRLHAFADALNVDPYAILLGVDMGSPEFAARCADNKLATIMLLALQDLDAAVGDDLVQLDPETLTTALGQTMTTLANIARQRAQRPGRGTFGPQDG